MSQTVLRPHADAVLRRVGNGAILVHLGSGHVFELNDTATRAWELAAEGLGRAAILTRLREEYAGDAGAIERDVDALFTFLAANGLLSG